jgi:hypothetical protein
VDHLVVDLMIPYLVITCNTGTLRLVQRRFRREVDATLQQLSRHITAEEHQFHLPKRPAYYIRDPALVHSTRILLGLGYQQITEIAAALTGWIEGCSDPLLVNRMCQAAVDCMDMVGGGPEGPSVAPSRNPRGRYLRSERDTRIMQYTGAGTLGRTWYRHFQSIVTVAVMLKEMRYLSRKFSEEGRSRYVRHELRRTAPFHHSRALVNSSFNGDVTGQCFMGDGGRAVYSFGNVSHQESTMATLGFSSSMHRLQPQPAAGVGLTAAAKEQWQTDRTLASIAMFAAALEEQRSSEPGAPEKQPGYHNQQFLGVNALILQVFNVLERYEWVELARRDPAAMPDNDWARNMDGPGPHQGVPIPGFTAVWEGMIELGRQIFTRE